MYHHKLFSDFGKISPFLCLSLLLVFFLTGVDFVNQNLFAEIDRVEVKIPQGTSAPGCEKTTECFLPQQINISLGSEVTWINEDSVAHTVTSGTPSGGPDGFFDGTLYRTNSGFSHQFSEQGEFRYYCELHPWATGLVIVTKSEVEEENTDLKPEVVLSNKTDTYSEKIQNQTSIENIGQIEEGKHEKTIYQNETNNTSSLDSKFIFKHENKTEDSKYEENENLLDLETTIGTDGNMSHSTTIDFGGVLEENEQSSISSETSSNNLLSSNTVYFGQNPLFLGIVIAIGVGAVLLVTTTLRSKKKQSKFDNSSLKETSAQGTPRAWIGFDDKDVKGDVYNDRIQLILKNHGYKVAENLSLISLVRQGQITQEELESNGFKLGSLDKLLPGHFVKIKIPIPINIQEKINIARDCWFGLLVTYKFNHEKTGKTLILGNLLRDGIKTTINYSIEKL